MDILVVSDTHGRSDRLLEAVARTHATTLLFLGDGVRDLLALPGDIDVTAVRGNCDFFGAELPEVRVLEIGAYRLFLTHGHRHFVKSTLDVAIKAAIAADADVLLFGHTHEPLERTLPAGTAVGDVTLEKPLLIFNPGSLGHPNGTAPTFGTLTVRNNGLLAAHGKL